jgi:hypothetical protein
MSAIFETSDSLFKTLALPVAKASASPLKATSFCESLDAALSKSDPENPELPPIAGSSDGIYANIVVNGKVVASLANSGCCVMLDGYGGAGMSQALNTEGEGPNFAQERAETIAQMLGGTVQKLSTAKTQEQWAEAVGESHVNSMWSLNGTEPPDYDPMAQVEAYHALLRSQEVPSQAQDAPSQAT